MIVIKRDKVPDGTSIQMEEWGCFPFKIYGREKVVACYPIMKFKPETVMFGLVGHTFRVEIVPGEDDDVEEIYRKLTSGEAALIDYKDKFYNSWCADCL